MGSPDRVFGLFSGGHDSLSASSLASRMPRFAGCVHLNTGIGIAETREFVRATCRRQGWPLLEYGPPETLDYGRMGPQLTYEEMVLAWGFPGPPQHKVMYTRLKERGLRALRRDYPNSLLVTGIRRRESVRRMRNFGEARLNWHSGFLWANPIADWDAQEVNAYLEREGLPRNPVVDLLHKSGECLCGAFAGQGEMAELETWFPDVAAYLHDLERRVEAAGRIGCVWGRRLDDVHRDQERLFPILPLCHSCEAA